MGVMSIARKEWREIVRDRRSLYSGLFYGIWGPLVMAMALSAFARNQQTDSPVSLSMTGTEYAAGLVAHLADKPVTIVTEPIAGTDVAALVRERRRTVVLQVGEDFAPLVRASKAAPVSLFYDAACAASRRDAAGRGRRAAAPPRAGAPRSLVPRAGAGRCVPRCRRPCGRVAVDRCPVAPVRSPLRVPSRC